MKKKSLFLLFGLVIGLSACTPTPDRQQNTEHFTASTTCGNITMGDGQFAYNNDFIYFCDFQQFYEYDLLSKETVALPSKHNIFLPSIYADNEYLYYAYNGLQCMTKDGKKHKTIYETTTGCLQLYIEGNNTFFLDGVGGSLYHRNLETNQETELISGVLAYYVNSEANSIYAIAQHNDFYRLYQGTLPNTASGTQENSESEENNTNQTPTATVIELKPMELSFQPIKVFATDGTLYLSKYGSWEIVMYKDGQETLLPMSSIYYQVLDQQLIYVEKSSDALKIYDLETGEETTILDTAKNFCILEEKYITFNEAPPSNHYYIYNLETETLELMYTVE